MEMPLQAVCASVPTGIFLDSLSSSGLDSYCSPYYNIECST